MSAKIIYLDTQHNNSNDIEQMLKKTVEILNDVNHSFTFRFDRCSYLSCSAIALMGALASLTNSLYNEEKNKVLMRKDFASLLQKEALSIFKHLLNEEKLRPYLADELNKIRRQENHSFTPNEIVKFILQDLFNNKEVLQFIVNLVQENNANKIGVMFNVESMSNQLKNQLIYCNFLSHFIAEYTTPYKEGKYIGFRMHKKGDNSDSIIQHIQNEWLTDERVTMSPSLKEDIVSRIFELYQNAFGHGISKSKIPLDVISCGEYDAQNETITLCIVDLGGGICQNVIDFAFLNEKLSAQIIDNKTALQWALKRGNTTKTDSIVEDMPRGVGLDLLKEFVHLNSGSLEIYTNDCKASINEQGNYEVTTLPFNFKGTMAVITINCDKNVIYSYENEPKFF